jgi:formylglycine-generating enzyme required for sulfatase activity
MSRLIQKLVAVVLILGTGFIAWTLLGLPPVRMLWRYGFSWCPTPTGRVLTAQAVEFVEIGPGCFRMGSDETAKSGDLLGRWCAQLDLPWGDQPDPSNEMPIHWVEFPRGFWIARTEVPNERYEAFRPKYRRSPYSPNDRDPVVRVSWVDANTYCDWLSKQSGLPIRLPSESEWECASRAGSTREFSFGDEADLLRSYAWYERNSEGRAHEVGTRRPNALGLHNTHGNVWEWCEDAYHPNYNDAPTDGTAWTKGGTQGRICRGGAFSYPAIFSRSACRFRYPAAYGPEYLGFRPAFLPDPPVPDPR